MGIVCSGPSKNFITPTMSGENGAFTEGLLVRISNEGFTPSELTLYESQCILFEWKAETPSQAFNVIQVTGAELNAVPGGYNSGSLQQDGSFKVVLGKKGQYEFMSDSLHDRLKTLKVQVLEKPPTEIKITNRGFETQLVDIREGDVIQWSCQNGDSEIRCVLREMDYCFKHGGFTSRKSRIEVKSTYGRTFHNTGLHFFYLETYDVLDWIEGQPALICIIKVTQRSREFSVHPTEDVLQPEFISARVHDRIWLDCLPNKIHGSRILDAYIYKDGLNTSPLVKAKLSGLSSSSTIADFISHEFTEPGLYRYVYDMADLSQLRGCVVVQPKPTEHVISIDNGRFKPALGTVKQGERVWWTLSDAGNFTLYLKELERCTPTRGLPARRRSLNSGCCKKAKDQAKLMSWLRLLTQKFEDIGVFTYWLQDDRDSVSSPSCCSIIVQRNVQHHTVKVRDQGFVPRILNVHPEDWVWWQWEGTKRPQNITQVTHQRTLMPGGFDSGKPTSSASAFGNIFTELGVFYFASNGLPEVFGAVVVTPEPQVHKIHVTAQGIQTDPLVISSNDCVSWMWFDGEQYSIQEISQPEDVDEPPAPPMAGPGKRCYSRVFGKPGMYHFLCTAHHSDEGEVHSQRTDSFIHTVLVDPVSYSCMVGVTADGFEPSTLTIAKSHSVLWTWKNQGSEEHNILHVRPPQDEQSLVRVRGLSAFDSGPVTSSSTFFHTFDVPGRYFITSEGTDRRLCIIDVLENAAFVSPPKIRDTERGGGNVESGYRVFLQCDTMDAEIFYTTDGSYPLDCTAEVLRYNKKKGIALARAGFVVVRAIAKKEGWVASQVFTSKRFWVLDGGDDLEEESGEEAEQQLETRFEEGDLKDQIFKWHWFSCRPSISVELVCDNTFNIDIALGSAADVSWIKGFQLYLNGTSYGGWFSPQCRGLVISGLIGGKVYHVVLVVFATHDSFEPQLSNEVVISCPIQSSSGGPLVSLEASTTPQSLVIVWPVYCDPRTAEGATYSVFINGQPFGEQIVSDPESDYCRVLFESSLEREVYTLCVACHLSGSDVLLYSNEVEFSLPVPLEILCALQKPNGEDDSSESERLDDGVPARELLLVAERTIPTPSVAEPSAIVKLSLKSLVGKLETIPEGEQLEVIAADAGVMEDAPHQDIFDTTGDVNAESKPDESHSDLELLGSLEGQNDAVDGESFIVVADESGLDASPSSALHRLPKDSSQKDEAYSELVGELDATIFQNFGEKLADKEPLVKSEEANVTESQPPVEEGADEAAVGNEPNIDRNSSVVIDDENLRQPKEQENQSSSETHRVPTQSSDSCHATVADEVGMVKAETEEVSYLDNEEKVFGMDEQSDSEFWDYDEKQNEEGSTKDDDLKPKDQSDISGQLASEDNVSGHGISENDIHKDVTDENDVGSHETGEGDTNFQELPDDKADFTETVKDDIEEGIPAGHMEHIAHEVKGQEDDTGGKDESLAKTDGLTSELSPNTENNSETEDCAKELGNPGSVVDEGTTKSENFEEHQDDTVVLTAENAQLNPETRDDYSEESVENSESSENNGVGEAAFQQKVTKLDETEAEAQPENHEQVIAGTAQGIEETQRSIFFAGNEGVLPKEAEGEERSDNVGESSDGEDTREDQELLGKDAISNGDCNVVKESKPVKGEGIAINIDKSPGEASNNEQSTEEDKVDQAFPGKNVITNFVVGKTEKVGLRAEDVGLDKPLEEQPNNGRPREQSQRDQTVPDENAVNSGNLRKVENEELKAEGLDLQATSTEQTYNMGGFVEVGERPEKTFERAATVQRKQMNSELLEETWSATSSFGSVKNDEDNTNVVETTEMPTFEETGLRVDAMSLSLGNVVGGEGDKVGRDDEESKHKTRERGPGRKDTVQGLDATRKDSIQEESEQLLPRPFLVIKGTTPTTVTLEWEWTLLPEQIAGSDIVYSVLILGSKFHSNINSSFCFNFEESPAKAMWPKQSNTLRQHSWRTTNTVIGITGLKQRCNYRLAVLGQLMPCANDSLSHVIPYTMPGPPKAPLIHVTDLKDREVTLTWKPAASFGEATVVGYRVLKDGMTFGEDLDCETHNLSITDLEEGKDHCFSLLSLTGHSVGDSNPSNAIIIHCPTPPISPQIYHKDCATVGSICVAWKQVPPVNTDSSSEHTQCSYSVFVDGMLHGEYPLDGVTDIFTDERTYTIPNCELGRQYEVCVKSYLNPQVIDSAHGQTIHVCGCYGDSSNVLELFCAGPPSPPIVRVSRIDQSGVTLSWSRSREYGGVTLGGYILCVNGRWSGELLPSEQQQTKLTGFNPGDVICVQLAAITNDLPAPIPALINQEGSTSRYFPSYEPPDSGVESSSSFLSKGSADELKQYACSACSPLVIQYSNLVRTVSSLEVIKLGCRSASIAWSLDDTADRSVEPAVLSAMYWKATEEEKSAIQQIVRDKPFRIKGLAPGTEYHVMLECVAPHLNDYNYNDHPINLSQSQPMAFKTGCVPGPPSNIHVVSATEQSIKLAWEAPIEKGVPVAAIRLMTKKTDQNLTGEGMAFQVSPDTCAFTFECLAPKTEYTFTFEALTEDDLFDMHEASTYSVASFSAWTNGVQPAEKLSLESRSPTSIVIKWQPSVAYGMSAIQHYIVHYLQNRQLRKRSRGRVGQANAAGKELAVESERCEAELRGLEPGTVYRIVVETVAGLVDFSYEEDFESEDSETNSAISSALSEQPPVIQQLYLSQPMLVCTAAPPEPPVLLISGFNSTQIQLSWNRPLLLGPVVDSQCAVGEDPARGRVRHLKGFRLEVNGRVYARLAANKTSITLKKCKSGMKYTCVVVVITGPEKTDGCQRKNETPDTAVSDTDTDEEITKSLSDCFEESSSDPVEVTLPRQDWGISLSAKYCANKPAGSLRDSPCSESGDEEGGVVVQWSTNELSGDVRGYRLIWYSSYSRERNEVFLPGDANGYEIWSVSLSAVYTVYLEILDVREEAVVAFGPLHCQTPGPPASPWIWCRTLSPYQFTIEWNEPVTYGDVTIRAYQVYLNDRRLEKLVDRRHRRVTIHCQSSSVYRVSVVALGSDPQCGDSPPSNVLKLCTPVVQDTTMGRRTSGGLKQPTFDINVHVLSTGNTSISFEWTHPPEIVDTADHYLIKWSSVLKPQVQELTLPLIQTCHVIDGCSPGTSHFLVVAAVNAGGGLVSRSEQYTVQTSAPVQQPELYLGSCLQSAITINWRKPTTFGNAEIDCYQLSVNGESERELEAECSYFTFTECKPCKQYTFLLKAFSTKPHCDSRWSEPLIVTCPGAETPLVTRIQSKQINCIRVGWERPVLRGGAHVQSYKVCYLQDKGDIVTSEDVVTDLQAVQHGSLPWYNEEDKLVPVPPDSYYWVVLQVELSPEDCQPVFSQPIRTRAAVSPDPPVIRLEVQGVEARRRLEERICELSIRRDRLHRIVHLLENTVVVKGSKLKDLQIAKATDTILEVDSELAEALEDIKEYTDTISAIIRWDRPCDDGDAVVSGYQVFVDGNRHGKPLLPSALQTHVKLPVTCHVIAVQTLTDHPVGPSPLSNPVELSGREFLPFVLFCYFDVHRRDESWPMSGCCSWDDSHSYELKHRGRTSGRVFVPRGILARRIPCPVFNVMDVFSSLWKPVAPVGINKMVAVLFWTKWCFSSQKILEYFLRFAEEFSDKFYFVTCCVRSEEPVTSHRQSVSGMMAERDWRKTGEVVTHTCGCNPQSQRTLSARRGVISEPDVCQLFGLVGVPTIILLDSAGYISWHGRCSCRDASSFRAFLQHAFSQVSRSHCTVPSCTLCELDSEDEHDTSLSEVDESEEKFSGHHRKPSVELNSLYQRLHGTSRRDDISTSPRPFTTLGESKKEHVRPKTTTAAGRTARSTCYNRFSGSDEPFRMYSRSFSAFGGTRPSRPLTKRPGSVEERSRTRTSQPGTHSSSQASSGDVLLPAMTRQRGKRTHPKERGSAPRVKTKISVEDFTLR